MATEWGSDESGTYQYREPVSSHPCTREELGLDASVKGNFNPVSKNSAFDLNNYQSKLICIDEDKAKTRG